MADGDPDLEDDDPAGDTLDERGEALTDDGTEMLRMFPLYAVDQTRGPTNEMAACKMRYRDMTAQSMTPGDHQALEALNRRLEHVESTATLLARTIDPRDLSNAMFGIAETIAELSNRLDGIINPPAPAVAFA